MIPTARRNYISISHLSLQSIKELRVNSSQPGQVKRKLYKPRTFLHVSAVLLVTPHTGTQACKA